MPKGIYKHKPNISYGMTGHKHSEKARKKMGEALKKAWANGKYDREWSEERKKKLSKNNARYWLGKTMSEEHKDKLSKLAKERGAGKWMKGRKLSEEIKKKIRTSTKGGNKTSWGKGHLPWNKGKKGVMRNQEGEKNPNWLGGSSFEPYGIKFNEKLKGQIRERDSYRCQECFRHQDELYYKSGKKYKLSIHHVDYDKKNNNPENLISLCMACHLQTNYGRKDWTDYFNQKVKQL